MPEWAKPTDLIAIALMLGAVAALFRDRTRRSTIETLNESNAALREQVALLKEQLQTMHDQGIESAKLLAATKAQNEVLRDALSAKVDVEAIQAAITHHHVAMSDEWRLFGDRFTEAMLTVGNRLDRNHESIGDLLVLTGSERTRDQQRERKNQNEPIPTD
jgi:siroheme synthase